MNFFWEPFILVGVGFLAGVVNTIAGGGSLLTLPMLIFLGLPPNIANGTNRISILIQNIFSTAGFKSKGISAYPYSLYLGLSALAGSFIGAYIAIDIKGELFNKILAVVMLVVVFFMVFRSKNNTERQERIAGKYFWQGIVVFFFIGIYGGFIQAGAGLFILLALSSINRFSLVKSNAAKTLVVFTYTLGAIAMFILNDKINWQYGLTLAFGSSCGAWFSSRWSVKKGDGLVRFFLVVVVIAMAVKLWFF